MDGLKAILTTMGIVFAALCVALIVLVVVWIVGNYRIDLLVTTIGVLLTAVGIVVMVVFYLHPRR